MACPGKPSAFSLESQRRAAAAIASGRFRDEIVPVERYRAPNGSPEIVDTDEHPRPDTTIEALARLKPAFRDGGSVTAGNASGVNNGAAALLCHLSGCGGAAWPASIARVIATAVAGVDPSVMGIGPVPAARKALARAGLLPRSRPRRTQRSVCSASRGVYPRTSG